MPTALTAFQSYPKPYCMQSLLQIWEKRSYQATWVLGQTTSKVAVSHRA